MEQAQNTGYLVVNTSTARGAIPLEGVSITVFDNDTPGNPIMAAVTTDNSGKSPRIALPAPDRSLSMQPGSSKPFASYLVIAEKEGYYPVSYNGVPVFSGVTSIQPVELLPLAYEDSANVYPRTALDTTEREDLSGGDANSERGGE